MVETRGAGGGSQGHTNGVLVGITDHAETTGPSWSNRERQGGLLRDMGDIQVDGGPKGSVGLVGWMGINSGKRRRQG